MIILESFMRLWPQALFRVKDCPLHQTNCKPQPLQPLLNAHAHMHPDGGRVVRVDP